MKHIPLSVFTLALLASISTRGELPDNRWDATVNVLGEDGVPIAGAAVSISYTLLPPPRDPNEKSYGEISGTTEYDGLFKAAHTDNSWGLAIAVNKTGFYKSQTGHELYRLGQFDAAKVNANRNFSTTVILKRIRKPIPMYAKHVEGGPPVFSKPVGYDLIVGDWVGPNGKGVKTDVIFIGELNQKAKNDFDYKLTIAFPKSGDGIQEFVVPDAEKGSTLKSPHETPQGGYASNVIKTMSRHPGKGTRGDMNSPDRNYFFRVRTVVDDKGNIVSANYGKIYGDFMKFTYYLNPTPNDRNVEFDPKHNLIKNLKPLEEVRDP